MTTAGSMRSSSRRASAALGRRPAPTARRAVERRHGAETEEDEGGHHPAEEEADHQGDQRTHAPMLGRARRRTGRFRGVGAARWGSVHLRRGRPFTRRRPDCRAAAVLRSGDAGRR